MLTIFAQHYIASIELRLRKVTETAAKRDREARTLGDRVQELETASEVIRRGRGIAEDKYEKTKVSSATVPVSWYRSQ